LKSATVIADMDKFSLGFNIYRLLWQVIMRAGFDCHFNINAVQNKPSLVVVFICNPLTLQGAIFRI
jgi:hypothetical protein